jgi:hypothetical protein
LAKGETGFLPAKNPYVCRFPACQPPNIYLTFSNLLIQTNSTAGFIWPSPLPLCFSPAYPVFSGYFVLYVS